MELQLLTIEDNDNVRNQIVEYFKEFQIDSYSFKVDSAEDFDTGIEKLKQNDYDLILLDLCKGDPSEDNLDRPGLEALETLRKNTFAPVIFYSGIAYVLDEISSTVVGVVNKGEGIERLSETVAKIVRSNIGVLKQKISAHVRESLRDFFWEAVHERKNIFKEVEEEVSLGYLMLRRLANSLSKESAHKILSDEKLKQGKAHPMEFYIYPIVKGEYNMGELLFKDEDYYVILTPSCDFIEEPKRPRKVGKVLLVETENLERNSYYENFKSNPEKYKQSLAELIESRKGDRYFFLPKTPFLKSNLVMDFQEKIMVNYTDLEQFERIARLDSPFAESMISSFIRYYNRVGFPDIDSDYIFGSLEK